MGRDRHSPEGRRQDRGAGQDPRGPGVAPAGSARIAAGRRAPPVIPPLHAALSAALQQRVAQRAVVGPRRPPIPRGSSLRTLSGCAGAPGAAGAMGRGDGCL